VRDYLYLSQEVTKRLLPIEMQGRGRTATQQRVAGPRGARGDSDLEASFREFCEVASEFTRSLGGPFQIRSVGGEGATSPRNLRLARSIFGKWSFDLLVLLGTGRQMGFSDLRRSLEGISARILASKLKRLEGYGLIYREVLPTHPPGVRYGLTERGMTVAQLGEPVLWFLGYIDGQDAKTESTALSPPSPRVAPRRRSGTVVRRKPRRGSRRR
jgi:DNA-binding HxlR family transcriptional regulator